jgi:hypothetical protein
MPSQINLQELRVIQYALCFLNANWEEDNQDDLNMTQDQISKLAEKYVKIYNDAKKEN